jgi:hypothetical protein
MTELSGVLTTLNHVLPSGLDSARLAQWMLKDGSDYMTFRSMFATALDGLNAELLDSWGDMIYITHDDHFEYPNGGAITKLPRKTDSDRSKPKKFSTVGHMIDLWTVGDGVGASKKFFRDTRQAILKAQIVGHIQRARMTFEIDVLTRFFNNTSNQLGSSGYDVPFCNASSGVSFAPPAWGGKTFDTTHTHYIGYNASTPKTFADVLEGLAETLTEHQGEGTLIAMCSETDVQTVRALANYVEPIANGIVIVDRGGSTSGNEFFERGSVERPRQSGARKFGKYQTSYGEVELRSTARLDTGYVGMYKSYGKNHEANPIAVRVHPDVGFGIRMIEVPSFDEMYPIEHIEIEFEYGVSCGQDRTAGAAGYLIAGGSWANPEINE